MTIHYINVCKLQIYSEIVCYWRANRDLWEKCGFRLNMKMQAQIYERYIQTLQ
jgi:hypothetical protein